VLVGVSVGVLVLVGVKVGVTEGVLVGVTEGVLVGVVVKVGVTEGVGVRNELNAAAHLSNGVITLTLITAFQPPHKSLYFSRNG
jgi:hypothetical protein